MTGAENLINTIINSASMIDRGFTVTITVQPHDYMVGYEGDYDEDEDDMPEIPDISEQTIANVKEFAHTFDSAMSGEAKSQLFDRYANLVKDKMSQGETLSDILGDIETDTKEFFKDIDDMLGRDSDQSWPKVGDLVWYKTKKLNYRCGRVKVVCHNTIQLEDMVTLERKDCMKQPFEVGEEVWFVISGEVLCGAVEKLNDVNCKVRTKKGIMQMPYPRLFNSTGDLLNHLKMTADE